MKTTASPHNTCKRHSLPLFATPVPSSSLVALPSSSPTSCPSPLPCSPLLPCQSEISSRRRYDSETAHFARHDCRCSHFTTNHPVHNHSKRRVTWRGTASPAQPADGSREGMRAGVREEGATHGASDVPRLLMGRASEGKEGAGVEE
ncbi:hypothetical protein E2C01_091521 [Portunus trituberculatus]|uniref:Uncharacterized protein n=1 Tax=Portunus trituberculatus TaxID=210409 RepID=A0A5B7JJ94_PORTR|nr:hypothetical protein [Portunus trituberculatus]